MKELERIDDDKIGTWLKIFNSSGKLESENRILILIENIPNHAP